MKMDDYMEYYIQGSDHYLIPKDIFDELFNEMTNWKEKCMELEKQNFNLREYIVVNKMAIPYEEIKDKSLYDLYTIPSYSDLSKENQELKKQLKIKHNGFMASVDESCELAEKNQKYKEVIDRLKSIVNDNNVSITRLELGLGILNIKNNLLVILNEVE